MKKITSILILLLCLQLTTQAQKNIIEVQSELLGGVPFSINNLIRPVNTIGISYLRQIHSQIYLMAGANFMSRSYEDVCNNCADGIGGSMFLDHFRVSVGGRYLLRPENKFRFNYFVEGLGTYEETNTGGQYHGGLSGGSSYYTNDFNGFGLSLKGGALLKLSKRFYLTSKLAIYRSRGDHNYVRYAGQSYPLGSVANTTTKKTMISLPLELAIAFRF